MSGSKGPLATYHYYRRLCYFLALLRIQREYDLCKTKNIPHFHVLTLKDLVEELTGHEDICRNPDKLAALQTDFDAAKHHLELLYKAWEFRNQ